MSLSKLPYYLYSKITKQLAIGGIEPPSSRVCSSTTTHANHYTISPETNCSNKVYIQHQSYLKSIKAAKEIRKRVDVLLQGWSKEPTMEGGQWARTTAALRLMDELLLGLEVMCLLALPLTQCVRCLQQIFINCL